MHVTIGLRASRTWHVWLQRVHGRIRSGVPARSLATRSGSAICARVISTAAHVAVVVPPSAHSAWPTSTIEPCTTTGTSTAVATRRRPAPMLNAGRLVEVGAGLLDREDRAADDDDVVDASGDQLGGDRRRHLGRDAGPRRQLVARQPQPDHAVGADGRPHGGDDVAGEAQAVGAPLVAALVRQPGQELAHEAVLAGVDLDAVAVRPRGRRVAAAPNPSTTAAMSSASIHFGTSRRRHLGHARRRPQRRWL